MDFEGDIGRWQRKIAESREGSARRRAVLKALAVEPHRSYLDVGCGGGHLVREMALAMEQKGRVAGIDPSAGQIAAARDFCKDTPIAELVEGDATRMTFHDDSFDGLASIQTLDYIPDVETALSEFHRVLKEGATLALVCVLWDHWRFHGAERELNDLILEAFRAHCAHQMLSLDLPHLLRDAGFEDVESTSLGFYNDRLEEGTFAYWGAKAAAHFAIEQGVDPEKSRAWIEQLEQANQEGRFGFVSVPVLTTSVARSQSR